MAKGMTWKLSEIPAAAFALGVLFERLRLARRLALPAAPVRVALPARTATALAVQRPPVTQKAVVGGVTQVRVPWAILPPGAGVPVSAVGGPPRPVYPMNTSGRFATLRGWNPVLEIVGSPPEQGVESHAYLFRDVNGDYVAVIEVEEVGPRLHTDPLHRAAYMMEGSRGWLKAACQPRAQVRRDPRYRGRVFHLPGWAPRLKARAGI